ncbi:M6 family metalloprotease domain-containing protein [candidate division WOR-3 bacterium]|nr:M6 family metalloprotease domain-containing protein [candidate division WOR-3 bacterium]
MILSFILAINIILMPPFSKRTQKLPFRAKHPAIDRPERIRAPVPDSLKAIVLLIDFPDKPHTHSQSEFQSSLFDHISGTMWDYYQKVSYSKFSLDGTVVLWVRAPNEYSYYCNTDDSTGTDDDHGFDLANFPHNVLGLVRDAVIKSDSQYNIDFSDFDMNGDSYVDALFVVHSGPGAEATGSADDIWSHKCSFSDVNEYYQNTPEFIDVDGVKVDVYSMEPEEFPDHTLITIGVFCHEFGHVLGLPDLYDIDYSSYGVGDFCIMASGSWLGDPPASSPAHFCAWCKYALGWVDPVALEKGGIKEIKNAQIQEVENSPTVYRLLKNPDGPDDWLLGSGTGEYFLIENRQCVGYDSYLSGSGLLILHVDESKQTNEDDDHPLVGVMQADGDISPSLGNRGEAGDLWKDNTVGFSNQSVPASYFYDGRPSGASVTNISLSSATMTADLKLFPVFLDVVYSCPNPFVKRFSQDYATFKYIPSFIEGTQNLFPDFEVRIFNLRGKLIKSLSTSCNDGNVYRREIYWDGKNDKGDEIASGLYYYLIEIPERGEKNKGKLTFIH